jgi:hypothetical protein
VDGRKRMVEGIEKDGWDEKRTLTREEGAAETAVFVEEVGAERFGNFD